MKPAVATEPKTRNRYRIEIVQWNTSYSTRFLDAVKSLRDALGDAALRIDHIGSTSVPGLAGKPILDMQVSVADLESFEAFGEPLVGLGYRFRPDNPEKTKRYFREAVGNPRTHIHVRRAGSWSEQWALLFRDYMRATPEEYPAYVELKRRLAEKYPTDMEAYTDGKTDIFWEIIRRADAWSKTEAWQPGPSDA